MTTTQFLKATYDLVNEGKQDAATDVVIDFIALSLVEHRFEVCDELLQEVDLRRLPPGVRRTILSMTLYIKNELPSRLPVHRQALELLTAEHGEAEAKRQLCRLA